MRRFVVPTTPSNFQVGSQHGGSHGVPNSVAGNPWTPLNWPGDGIQGDRNYYSLPTRFDAHTSMQSTTPAVRGGYRYHRRSRSRSRSRPKHSKRRRKWRGGMSSNSVWQDVVNAGRQIEYGSTSAYRTLAAQPVLPAPFV